MKQLNKEDLRCIECLTLMDDGFMTACFSESPESVELFLRIIMNKKDLKVKKSIVQRFMKNIQGRSVCLDVSATDDENKEYDVEVQKSDDGAIPQRARYHSSLMDANTLHVGADFSELPESYVIFICENDVLGGDQSIYEIERMIKGLEHPFNDGSHIIYVNGKKQDDTDLGKLMHDFHCSEPDDMYYKVLAERASYFKKTEGGRQKMGSVMDELRDEAAKENSKEIARKMLQRGKDTVEEISEITALSEDEIETLKGTLTA